MRKIAFILLTLLITISLIACAETQPDATISGTEVETSAPATESVHTAEESTPAMDLQAETEATESTDNGELGFTYNGVTVQLNALAAPVVNALGEPMSYTEQPSCAFDGLDKTYYYGSFYLDTYPGETEDYIYGFWFADDSVATGEGICIGATQEQVETAYGSACFNGENAYIISAGSGTLTVIVENGYVTSIQYAIDLQ